MTYIPGGGGGGGAVSTSSDVALNNPENGHVLTYDASLAKWKNSSSKGVVENTFALFEGQASTDVDPLPTGIIYRSATTLTHVALWARQAPTGSSLTITWRQGSSTLATVSLASGSTYVEQPLATPYTLNAGVPVVVAVTSVGSTTPGAQIGAMLVTDASQPGTAPEAPAGFAYDFTGADAAEWDSTKYVKSTSRATQTAPSGPSIQANTGRLVTNSVGSYSHNDDTVMMAQTPDLVDAETSGRVRFSNTTAMMYPNIRERTDPTATSSAYILSINPSAGHWRIERFISGTNTVLSENRLVTFSANTWYRFKFQVQGTALRAKVWPDTAAEPLDWLTASDTSISSAGKQALCLFAGNTAHAGGVDYIEYDDVARVAL